MQSLCDDYLKRLSPFAKVRVEEIPAVAFRRESDKAKSKELEGERIMARLARTAGQEIILLDERGAELTSTQLAGKMKSNPLGLVFVIGGTLGFDQRVLALPHSKLALSRLTLIHEMARMVLLEQAYRAMTIIKGKSYHY